MIARLAPLWPRPTNHMTMDFMYSRPATRCPMAIIHIWKNAGTATERELRRRAAATRHQSHQSVRTRNACEQQWGVEFDWRPWWTPGRAMGSTPRIRRRMHAILHDRANYIAAFVRDPIDRFLSGFYEIIARLAEQKPQMVGSQRVEAGAWEAPRTRAALLSTLDRLLDSELAFSPPAQNVTDAQKEWLRNFHLAPQVTFLSSWEGERFRLDYLGRSERLSTELSFLLHDRHHALAHAYEVTRYDRASHPKPLVVVPSPLNVSVTHHREMLAPRRSTLDPGQSRQATSVLAASLASRAGVPRIDAATLSQERPDLVRKICSLTLVDFCCFGLFLPAACRNMTCVDR